MKIRLRENSIRLRLLQNEVEELRRHETVSEKIRFSQSQTLTYSVKVSGGAAEISAFFINSEIVVEIPSNAAQNWTETDLVGLSGEQTISDDLTLKILIEKDFVCLERPLDADNADAFPHPKTIC